MCKVCEMIGLRPAATLEAEAHRKCEMCPKGLHAAFALRDASMKLLGAQALYGETHTWPPEPFEEIEKALIAAAAEYGELRRMAEANREKKAN